MSKYYCGIDLGKLGSIVVIKDGEIIFKRHMPTEGDDESARPDTWAIVKILKVYAKEDCHAVLEKFGGFFGYAKSAVSSLSGQAEQFVTILELLKMPYTRVTPPSWQKEMFSSTTVKMKKGKQKGKDNKAMALTTVNRLFPGENLLKNSRCKVPHSGIVDGILLAEYGRRKNL
jgi:hypothetical protein